MFLKIDCTVIVLLKSFERQFYLVMLLYGQERSLIASHIHHSGILNIGCYPAFSEQLISKNKEDFFKILKKSLHKKKISM